MDRIEELHQKVLAQATSPAIGRYIWDTSIKPQMGYSFSRIHSLAYTFIGLQTVYMPLYYPDVYWNTACLRVDSGLEEDDATNYGKIAKAVGNIMSKGVNLTLLDINKSRYMFEPDEENNRIVYGLKALNGVGGELVQEIIENAPYLSLADFLERSSANKTAVIALIKGGAFDQFGERADIMKEYIWSVCEPKKRITMQNFNGLVERDLIPEELTFQKRVFRYNKALKKNCKLDKMLIMTNDNYYNFYEEFFDVDLLEPCGAKLGLSEIAWKKQYDAAMAPAKEYIKKHHDELLAALNNSLFQEQWQKYAAGSYSKWEMESLGMYYHEHELINVQKADYDIVDYESLAENPVVARSFKKGGVEIPIFRTDRIIGTVIDKNDARSSISILTPLGSVVDVKLNRDYFAKYNRRITDFNDAGEKKIMEKGWFQRGTLVMINGFRRGDMFVTKTYVADKKLGKHQLYKITEVRGDGTIEYTNRRYGEYEDAA